MSASFAASVVFPEVHFPSMAMITISFCARSSSILFWIASIAFTSNQFSFILMQSRKNLKPHPGMLPILISISAGLAAQNRDAVWRFSYGIVKFHPPRGLPNISFSRYNGSTKDAPVSLARHRGVAKPQSQTIKAGTHIIYCPAKKRKDEKENEENFYACADYYYGSEPGCMRRR